MKLKQMFKMTIDIAMTILFMIQMAYHITGNHWHEILGIAVFVLFIIHHILNRKWYAALFKGHYSAVRVLITAVNLILLADVIAIMVSGIMLSRDVFSFLNIRAGMFGRRLHMVSTAWGYVLIALHIGMHWGMMIRMIKKKLSIRSKIGRLSARILFGLFLGYGIFVFIERGLIERMILLVEYVFFDFEEPTLFFFIDYFSILVVFAAVTYYLSKWINQKE